MTMQLAARPLIIVNVALVGASLIAVTPMARPLPHVQFAELQLIDSPAGIDPIMAIQDVFNLAQTNSTAIFDHFAAVPFPTLEQIIADPGSFNLQDAATAAITPFLPTGVGMNPAPDFLYPSLTTIHVIGYHLIQQILTSDTEKELLAFTASPLSAVLLGDLGPLLDPGLALQNSISDALTAPDPTSALNDLVNIPANIADATLNGEFLDGTTPELDLTSLLSLLPAGTLPSTVDITSVDLTLGGLLSGGGSLFNALGADLTAPLKIDIAGVPVGPLASVIELDQSVAAALGFNFNDVPTDMAGLSGSISDLLSGLTSSLDGDLSTLLGGSAPEVGTLTTDILTGLTSLF
jgi:hypothetical protein